MKLLNKEISANGKYTLSENVTESRTEITLSGENAGITSARLVYSFDFEKSDRLFVNGYESWSLSKETDTGYFDNSMKYCPAFIDKKYGFSRYGDRHFYKNPRKKGITHGYSYAYIRRGDEYILIGSLSEKTGFTRIVFNTKENTITLEKDCIGRSVSGEYTVFDFEVYSGKENEVFDAWFSAMGVKSLTQKKAIGYCSWYNYYQNISEEIILRDLDGMDALKTKPEIFQIDDGYQAFVGDWLTLNEQKFPEGLEKIASKIKEKGYKAGLWLAPFVCEKKSKIYREHKDWMLKEENGEPLYSGSNWSGMYALDIYNPEVREHIRKSIEYYKSIGFSLFKLDFLYAACIKPRSDKTRGEIMSDGMDFLREVCSGAEILGCGVPLASAFGKVEYCRIGMDMTLDWNDKPFMRIMHSERNSTRNTMLNTLYRRELSGRAFMNDPDVFLLRDDNIILTKIQKSVFARLNCLFGGVLFTSDNFADYDEEKKREYEHCLSLKEAKITALTEENGRYKVAYECPDGKKETIVWDMKGNCSIQ